MKIKAFIAAALIASLAPAFAMADEAAAPKTLFEYPTVPDKLTKPTMRANYMVEHLWDKCDLEKTVITDIDAFHNTFTDYLSFFAVADRAVVEKSIKKFVERAVKNSDNMNLIYGMLQTDLYSLYSPYCSDEAYNIFATNIVASKKASKELKAKVKLNADILNNSAVGAQVADFPLRQSPSGVASLYGLSANTTVLFFNADGNIDCKIWKVRLSASLSAAELIKSGNLRIVSIYPTNDVDDKLSTEPADWEVACLDDANNTFDQRLAPTVYLLDKDKKITTKFVGIDDLLAAIDRVAQSAKTTTTNTEE